MEVEKLQRYDLVERIAAGGMGEVFRAKATGPHGFEKILAVKRVLPELSSDEEFVARFVRECKLAVSLSHANIVQVFDLGRAGNDLFLVMEYVHGTDLARLLNAAARAGRTLPMELALLIVAEAAQGLAYAHSRDDLWGPGRGAQASGVVHCDISPSNLLLSYAGEVKVTDFGVAQLLDHTRRRPTESQLIMGKWRYMAPEQIRGEGVDGRTDLYALGVVLYEMLSGRRAFGGDGVKATCDLVLTGEVAPLSQHRPDVPEAIARFVHRAMSTDPARRPADAREFLTQLSELQRGMPGQVTSLDLGALVRELLPPPPETARSGGLSALFQPMIVEHSGGKSGSVVHRRRPTASFVAQVDNTNSEAITQWIPTQGDERWPRWARAVLGDRRLRWRVGRVVPVVAALLVAAMGVGLATGLRLRRAPDRGEAQGGDPGPQRVPTPEQRGVGRIGPEESLPRPVERIPDKLGPLRPEVAEADRTRRPDADADRAVRRAPGYLDVYVEPWANVIIDGRAQAKPTPLTKVPLRPGPHHVVLVNPKLNKSKTVDITVIQGQTQKVEAYFLDK